ncbi:MBL fold metallo-hydrolase [Williamsia muralis]|uniref:MBL fold metallo-hydrolase n=1 Tax=Williamsia marianensis TaxID=85044 RepID=A0A2G3PJZ7_WILMA|nr:MBL fold metallo-hydrolase [Williamsia marianensis]PHV66148.1 MBL fold metallo-hydrolase [Williamsia marianensis]
MTSIKVGKFLITELADGEGHLPPMFYPGADFASQPELLHDDGTYHIRAGAYLIESEGVVALVDAGSGPDDMSFPAEVAAAAGMVTPPANIMTSGRLPDSIAQAGITPDSVTHIVLTHLHSDHVGWVAPRGESLYFPNAEVYYGEADWPALIENAGAGDPAKIVMEYASTHGVLHAMTTPTFDIVPGVRAIHAPGHTPGSYIVSVGDGDNQVYLTGDVIQHPDQLSQRGIHFLTDGDRDQATKTREQLIETITASGSPIATSHIPSPVFRKVGKDGDWEPAA